MIIKKLKSLNNKIDDFLCEDTKSILEKIHLIFKEKNFQGYLVGGIIRDIFLSKNTLDIDIVSPNFLEIGNYIINNFSIEKYRINENFLTFNIKLTNGINIDIASPRNEVYPFSGSLPIVSFCDIEDDVARRDFSINSIYLNLQDFKIFDKFNGIEDIKNKKVKILHNKSFYDDPTRILRGIKFASRYNFSFDKGTDLLIKKAVDENYLENISSDRLRNELLLLFKEKNIESILYFLKDYNILNFLNINIDIKKIKEYIDFYNSLNEKIKEKFFIDYFENFLFIILFFSLNNQNRENLFKKFNISKKKIRKINEFFFYYLDISTF